MKKKPLIIVPAVLAGIAVLDFVGFMGYIHYSEDALSLTSNQIALY